MATLEGAPTLATVLTLIGDVVFWIPSGFYLIGLVENPFPLQFLPQILVVPPCTFVVLACAVLMGRVPRLHVLWGSLVLLISSIAVAIDFYILLLIASTVFGFIIVVALGLIVVGGILSIVWRPDVRLATEINTPSAP
jgi:hypothetical protein